MIIHFHHSLSPNSGDVKRISNIDREFSKYYNEKSIEVVFCPLRKLKIVKGKDFFKLSNFTVKKYCIPLIPRANFLNPYYETLILVFLSIVYRPKVLIGEMFFPAKFAKILKKISPKVTLFADIHGAIVDENLYVNPNIDKKKLAKLREVDQNTAKSADYVICQSEEMKKYIVSNYNVNPKKICVYRCGYDAALFKLEINLREQIRKKLAIKEDDILFVYSGGLHKWQKVDESLKLFKKYNAYQQNSKMLVLTSDNNQLGEMLAQEEFKQIRNKIISLSVPFNAVPVYLNACDIAFLLRDNHIMNAVASPTKLAEYFACGLPVISSKVSRYWVDEEAMMYLLDAESENINEIIDAAVDKLNKQHISQYAIDKLSLDIDHRNICTFFHSIAL